MKKYVILTLALIFILSSLSFAASPVYKIDDTQLNKGIVSVSYKSDTVKIIKVMITKDTGKYVYNLSSDGTVDSFPLQMGNGDYKVSILENVGGTKYAYVTTKTVKLNLTDSNIVFLNSIQNVEWNNESLAVKKDLEIIGTDTNVNNKLANVYKYVIDYFTYDYDKIKTLTTSYFPQIDPIYSAKKGICYDYSAILASMKRSEGLPTKLIKGYTKNVDGYHAWNEVYIDGKWQIIDSTYDSVMYHAKAKYSMFKNAADYQKVNEY
jgi:hypothetical protein